MTAQQMIYRALRRCGQLRPGAMSNADLLNDGFLEFVDMYDSWNAERTMQYSQPDYVYPVTGPGHGTTGNGQTWNGTGYQIGPGALDFNGPRPTSVIKMNLLYTQTPTSTRLPISMISMEEWLNIITTQFQPINIATIAAYDPQYPIGVIWVWPPLNGNSLEIFTWGFLTPPANLAATVAVPPGYADAITWTLAQRLYGLVTNTVAVEKFPLSYIVGQAKIARDRAKQVNIINESLPRLGSDFSGGSRSSQGTCDWDLLLAGVPY